MDIKGGNSVIGMVCLRDLLHNHIGRYSPRCSDMKIVKIIIMLALFLIALALGSQNQEVVNFNYLIAQGDFHLSTLLGVIFVSGFVLAWAMFGGIHLRSQLQIRKLKKQVKKLSPTDNQPEQVKAK